MVQDANAAPALIRLGSRGSPLALAQAEEVRRRLAAAHPDLAAPGAVAITVIRTTGDRVRDRPLADIGGKGLFTKEIEQALADGHIDAAVHSMKDVPTWLPEEFEIAAILPREDPRDAFFSEKAQDLKALPSGAVVGTASLRRQAQVLALRADLKVTMLRGNVETRLRKLRDGEVDATLLAVAGLNRLEMAREATALLSPEEMLPAAGQGAIGLEMRRHDRQTKAWLEALDDSKSHGQVVAERACLAVLDGSCRTPIGVLAETDDEAGLRLRALVASPDGEKLFRTEHRGASADALSLGQEAGQELRSRAGKDFFDALAEL